MTMSMHERDNRKGKYRKKRNHPKRSVHYERSQALDKKEIAF